MPSVFTLLRIAAITAVVTVVGTITYKATSSAYNKIVQMLTTK